MWTCVCVLRVKDLAHRLAPFETICKQSPVSLPNLGVKWPWRRAVRFKLTWQISYTSRIQPDHVAFDHNRIWPEMEVTHAVWYARKYQVFTLILIEFTITDIAVDLGVCICSDIQVLSSMQDECRLNHPNLALPKLYLRIFDSEILSCYRQLIKHICHFHESALFN